MARSGARSGGAGGMAMQRRWLLGVAVGGAAALGLPGRTGAAAVAASAGAHPYGLIVLAGPDADPRSLRVLGMGGRVDVTDLSDQRVLAMFQAVAAAGQGVWLDLPSDGAANGSASAAVAVAQLILGGVLDACPTLRVGVAHEAGVLAMLTRAPNEYLRRFSFDRTAGPVLTG